MKLVKKMALAATLSAASLSAVPAFSATTLIFGEPGPNRGARAADVQWLADEVGKRSGGDLKINIQWGGALFKAKGARQAISSGVADLGTIIPAYFPKELVGHTIGDLPFPNRDAWVGVRALNDHMQSDAVKASLARQNLAYVAPYNVGEVALVCKSDAVKSLDDIKGKKVRGIGAYGKVFADLGASPVNMSVYKAYQGLDTGLLDCTQSYMAASAALKHNEVANSVTKMGWGVFTGLGIFINKDVRDGLSDSQKAVLDEVAADFVDHHGKNVLTGEVNGERKLADGGLEMLSFSAADTAKLVASGESYIADWAKQASASGMDGAALVEQYRAAVSKYSQERDSKGYPWAR
ncbi:MAG: C4-dicarboxylate TRAP transporter substrate-binding protein [Motiliproteus sp.]